MALIQPAGVRATKHPVDLSDADERRRLSASGLKAFFRIVEAWGLNGKQELKRLVEARNVEGIKPLSQDQLQRISYVIGITKALRILHGTEIADEWMRLQNANPMFAGGRPIDLALKGGIPALAEIRKLLDSRRGMNA
jgi:hypothetical protein